MSAKNQIGKNMMLVTSSFRNVKSFNLIPLTQDCPYTEAMYDPASGILACITKVRKQSFHMVPRLDDNGQPQRLKAPNKETGKVHKEQRVTVDTFSEFYITEKSEIENFMALFAVNFAEFDYKQYLNVDEKETKKSNIIMSAT
jgi:hypothetical protein|tara:strand:+ start:9920 stop:10348 length:429 start_codon:yes stop_codon:yes gene_type:complete